MARHRRANHRAAAPRLLTRFWPDLGLSAGQVPPGEAVAGGLTERPPGEVERFVHVADVDRGHDDHPDVVAAIQTIDAIEIGEMLVDDDLIRNGLWSREGHGAAAELGDEENWDYDATHGSRAAVRGGQTK